LPASARRNRRLEAGLLFLFLSTSLGAFSAEPEPAPPIAPAEAPPVSAATEPQPVAPEEKNVAAPKTEPAAAETAAKPVVTHSKEPSPSPETEIPASVAPPTLEWFRKNLTLPNPTLTKLEQKRLEDAKIGMRASKRGNWPAPSSSIASPAGFGAQWTEVFFGASVQNRPRYRRQANGTGYLGFGLGNPRELVGLEVSIGIYGLIPPGERGGMNLKLHRLLGEGFGIAVGRDNVFVWGGADAKPAHYVALSKTFNLSESVFDPFSMLTLHGGIGDGGYRSEADVFADKATFGWFAAAGLRVLAPLGIIVNWSGQDLFAGFSVTPSRKFPVILTFAAQDLMGRAGDGTRFSFSIAYTESIYNLPILN
jgi:hypothetical protein